MYGAAINSTGEIIFTLTLFRQNSGAFDVTERARRTAGRDADRRRLPRVHL